MSDSVTKWHEMQEEKDKTFKKNTDNMSKMSEIDQIAQGIADITMELMYDSVEWQIADQPVEGDDYNKLHSMVMEKAIEYMWIQTKHKEQQII